jgi:transcription elongation factor Elf1
MSLIIGNNVCITYLETEIECPICNQKFDASTKMDKAKYSVFNTKCEKCKGKITISVPIFGGELICYETNCPKSVERLETTTPNKYNGKILVKKLYDDNSDEPSDIFV